MSPALGGPARLGLRWAQRRSRGPSGDGTGPCTPPLWGYTEAEVAERVQHARDEVREQERAAQRDRSVLLALQLDQPTPFARDDLALTCYPVDTPVTAKSPPEAGAFLVDGDGVLYPITSKAIAAISEPRDPNAVRGLQTLTLTPSAAAEASAIEEEAMEEETEGYYWSFFRRAGTFCLKWAHRGQAHLDLFWER